MGSDRLAVARVSTGSRLDAWPTMFVLVLMFMGSIYAHGAGQREQPDELDRALRSTGAYIAEYERKVLSIVAEEHYVQRIPAEGVKRELRSDVVVVADPIDGWLELRDVFEVDAARVRDRDDRIVSLFMKPSADARVQGRRIADESARFNLDPRRFRFRRTANVPLTALRFLRRTAQPRSAWTVERGDLDGQTVVVLKLQETSTPRIVASNEGTPASGSFTIDPATGTVLRSQFRMNHRRVRATFTVAYGLQPALDLHLPVRMEEQYTIRDWARDLDVRGRADYSNFRQFKVDTSIVVR